MRTQDCLVLARFVCPILNKVISQVLKPFFSVVVYKAEKTVLSHFKLLLLFWCVFFILVFFLMQPFFSAVMFRDLVAYGNLQRIYETSFVAKLMKRKAFVIK